VPPNPARSVTGADIKIEPPLDVWMRLLRESPERVDKEVRKRFRDIARDVRDDARSAARAGHPVARFPRTRRGGQRWSDLVNSIRSGATSTTPYVAIGSARVPWALGFEFGSLGDRTVKAEGFAGFHALAHFGKRFGARCGGAVKGAHHR